MIYETARFADADHATVTGTDADGNTETVPIDFTLFRQPEHGPQGYLARGGTIADYAAPPEPGPLDQSLTKRQIIAAMIVGAGTLDPDAAITSAIEAITDPVARALALNDWRNAPHYVRSHPLFNDPDLMAAMNLTSSQIDALWTLGTQQPA